MSPERTKRTKKKLGKSSVRLGLWQARQQQPFCAPAWGYFEAYQLFLSPRWRITIREEGGNFIFLKATKKRWKGVNKLIQVLIWKIFETL